MRDPNNLQGLASYSEAIAISSVCAEYDADTSIAAEQACRC